MVPLRGRWPQHLGALGEESACWVSSNSQVSRLLEKVLPSYLYCKYLTPQVSLACCLLLLCSSQSPGAVNSIALSLILIRFHCSAAQFPALTLGSAVQWLSAPHQPDIVSSAAYRSSNSVLLVSKYSVIFPSLLMVIGRPPVSSCMLQVHILSNEELKQACCGWDHLDYFSTAWWKPFLEVPLLSWKYVRRE